LATHTHYETLLYRCTDYSCAHSGFSLIGTVLARTNTIRVRTAPTYTRVCTILVLGAYYGITHYEWPGVHLRELDFWSLLVILAIGAYA